MMIYELLGRLKEFYYQCSNRGWCRIESQEGKDFITVLSSETNFTQLPLNFCRFPNKCLVSPKLSMKNINKIEKLISSNDSSRLLTMNQYGKRLVIKILSGKGKIIHKETIKLYSIKSLSKSQNINYKEPLPQTVLERSKRF